MFKQRRTEVFEAFNFVTPPLFLSYHFTEISFIDQAQGRILLRITSSIMEYMVRIGTFVLRQFFMQEWNIYVDLRRNHTMFKEEGALNLTSRN